MTGSMLDGLLGDKANTFDDFEAWRPVISETFMPLQVDRSADGDFHGALRKQRVGSLRFATMKSGAHRSTQTSRLARQDNSDSYAIGLQIVGRSTFSQDGRVASLGPGDFRWLLEQRLERAHADLLNARLNGYSIAEIATRDGFASHRGFSRQFRSRYGDTPRNLRRSGPSGDAELD